MLTRTIVAHDEAWLFDLGGLVETGPPPTVELPAPALDEAEPSPPAYAPCPTCGVLVLTGRTPAGVQVAVDTHVQSYTVLWLPKAPEPLLHESRGYPVHRCDHAGPHEQVKKLVCQSVQASHSEKGREAEGV
jgi:hypothetical protein